MKKWRVHLIESTCGDIWVEAETEDEAEEVAMKSPGVIWDDSSTDTEVSYAKVVSEEEYQQNQ